MTDKNAYWRANLRLIGKCLIVWFVVSYLFSIVLVDVLNYVHIFGYKLGFWFAQQGSIYVFIVLIFYYGNQINKIDEHFLNRSK